MSNNVNSFMVKCKNHRVALVQAKKTFVKVHSSVKQSQLEHAKAKDELDELLKTESSLKKKLVSVSVAYDEELRKKSEKRAEISALRSELYKLKKEFARVEQEENAASVGFDKAYLEHSNLEAEARKWSERLNKSNKVRIKYYETYNLKREQVEKQKDTLFELKEELEAIRTIVNNTLTTADKCTTKEYREKHKGEILTLKH